MSSRSSNTLKSFKARHYDPESPLKLNLTESQLSTVFDDLSHEIASWAPQAPASWGVPTTYKVSEKLICLNDTTLIVNLPPLTGLTGGAPRLCSSSGFYAKVEYKTGGTTKDIAYPEFNHILTQTMNSNDDRAAMNASAGSYSSISQRTALCQTTSQYIINLNSLFNFANYPIMNSNQEVEFVVTWKNLVDVVVLNGATGVPVMPMLTTYIQSRITRMSPSIAIDRLSLMKAIPEDTFFHSTSKTQSFNLAVGLTSAPLVLVNLARQKVAALFFIMRPTSRLNQEGAHSSFEKIQSFNLRNSSGVIFSGSQDITDTMALTYLSQFWSNSTVQLETSTGTLTDFGQNIYCFSHSSNICDAYGRGRNLSSRYYEGNESLNLSFKALTVPMTVDVFTLCQSVLRQSESSVEVMSA